LRDEEGLANAVNALLPAADSSDPALVALLVAVAAIRRPGRIGSYWRTDGDAGSPLDMPLLTAADALMHRGQIDFRCLARSA
jgi:L-aspartate oxidase